VVTIGWYAAVIHENGTLYRHGKGKVCVGAQKNHSATKVQWWFRTNYGNEHPQENPFTSGKSDLLKLVAFVLRIIRAEDKTVFGNKATFHLSGKVNHHNLINLIIWGSTQFRTKTQSRLMAVPRLKKLPQGTHTISKCTDPAWFSLLSE
jgi:hypothetical protein